MFPRTKGNECPKVYIVEPYGGQHLQQIHQLRMLFLRFDWQVEKLDVMRKTYHPNSIILVPDTGGINTNVSYFVSTFPPSVPAQDQGLEYWRLHLLHYYVKKGIPLLGLGMSAFLIFAEVCQGKLIYGDDGISCGTSKDGADIYADHFVGKMGAGFFQYHINENLVAFAETLLRKNEQGGAEVYATVPLQPKYL